MCTPSSMTSIPVRQLVEEADMNQPTNKHHEPTNEAQSGISKNTEESKMQANQNMNYQNDSINWVNRFSNAFRIRNIGILVAGAALGLALTAGVAMSGPASVPGSVVVDNLNDDFSMVYGIPDSVASGASKIEAVIDNLNDDFSMVYGVPDSIAGGASNDLGEEFYHPATGELDVGPATVSLGKVDAVIDNWPQLGDSEYVSGWLGWVLRFDNNLLSYYNCGDNAKILFDTTPPEVAEFVTRIVTWSGSS